MGQTAREKSGLHIGDKVCALVGGGGYADTADGPYRLLMPVPKNLTLEEEADVPDVPGWLRPL